MEAVGLLHNIKDVGVELNIVCYNATISACEKGRKWEKALQLFQEMRENGIEPNVISYSSTISDCKKGRNWEK